jgi:glycosyltransferase involved in cell wall biosynthesis
VLISFVFSFRNEQENIPELVRRVAAAATSIADAGYEMIFVNDDSTDHSLQLLTELQRQHPITIVSMSRRFGVTPCVLAGFAESRGDAVIYLDSDLQDPPELIPEMVQRFRGGAEVVHTTRTHRDGESAFKMWVTRRAYRTINYFADISLPENTGDFKLLSRKVVEHILALPEYDPYMRGLAIWVGFKQDFVLYRREARFGGRTKMPLLGKGPIKEFIRGLTAFSAAPLYVSFFLGLATSILAVVLILYALITKLAGVAAQGASSVLIAEALFGGVILMTNGVIGLYVARIYDEAKRRPKYIVKSIARPPQG